ncbi:conserved hypothetical protein [Carnobacterium maltaromaticum]|nr:conserved hypothetical protein [Carnobacterium maltaromaticum]
MDDFSKQKIIWPDIAMEPRFAFSGSQIFFNDTCFMIVNAPKEILAFLNSSLMKWYFPKIASDLGNGFRYKKQFVELLNLPNFEQNKDFFKNIEVLMNQKNYEKIDALIYNFYRFSDDEIKIIKEY